MACELRGRWNKAALRLVRELVAASVADPPGLLKRSMHLALSRRWWGILNCAIQRAFASSLGEMVHHPTGCYAQLDLTTVLDLDASQAVTSTSQLC